jgi:predicted transcriptional regulator
MYYPKGGGRLLKEQCLIAGQVQSENARAILDYVCENPGSHQRQIARALDLNHGTARWHLSRFEENELLESRKEGRTTTYRLSDKTERVLSRMPPLAMQQAAPA